MLQTDFIDALPQSQEPALPPGSSKRRVMIVDDNSFFSRCLAALINHEADLMVCDTANSYVQLVKIIVNAHPQLLLMDVCIGEDNGIEIAKKLRSMKVEIPILLTSSVAEPTSDELLSIGRCSFISKFQKPADFLRQIRAFTP